MVLPSPSSWQVLNLLDIADSNFFFIYLIVTNTLPASQLHDYSCLDNIERVTLINSYHRLTLNYAQIAESLYSSSHPNHVISSKILEVVKRNHDDTSSTKITNFRNLLKFREAVPPLVRLLRAGGVWTVDCETAYSALVKCRVEKVNEIFIIKQTLY